MLTIKFRILRKERNKRWTVIRPERYRNAPDDGMTWAVSGDGGPEEVFRKVIKEIVILELFDNFQAEAFTAAIRKCFYERRRHIRFRVRKTTIKDHVRYINFEINCMEVYNA